MRILLSQTIRVLMLVGVCLSSLGVESHAFQASLTARTIPVSASVLATVLTRGRNVELLLLWRGEPGWFLGGGHRGEKYSEANHILFGTLDYAGRTLTFAHDPSGRIVKVQDSTVRLT